MGLVHNTAYTTKVDDITDDTLESCNIENGALARTTTGLYMGHGSGNVRIYPQLGGKGGYYESVETLTSGRALTTDDHIIFTNFSTEQTVTLPLATGNKGVEYIIRARTNSENVF
jgi:hypothetical protein